MPIKNRFSEMLPEITAIRRDLHENPEILFETHRTSQVVADQRHHTERWPIGSLPFETNNI